MTYSINTPQMAVLLAWLRGERERQGMTMRALASRLGKPHSYVQKVEQGERRLDVVEYVWYCDALGVSAVQGIRLLVNSAQ